MKVTVRYVGLDVHADTIVIAVAEEGRDAAKVLATIPYGSAGRDCSCELFAERRSHRGLGP